MELTGNAISAPIGYRLGEGTHLPRRELLSAIGTSAVWPDINLRKQCESSMSGVIRIEKLLGCSIDHWLSMILKDRICYLGLDPITNWVSVTVLINSANTEFMITVQSKYPPLEGDIQEILQRFKSPLELCTRVREERSSFEDKEGIYHMPTFTGGGGMGLLECMRIAAEKGLNLSYCLHNDAGISLSLANYTIASG